LVERGADINDKDGDERIYQKDGLTEKREMMQKGPVFFISKGLNMRDRDVHEEKPSDLLRRIFNIDLNI